MLASPQVPHASQRNKKGSNRCYFLFMVEVTGLEPTTFWSLTRRATKLRYTSISRKQRRLLYLIKSKMPNDFKQFFKNILKNL